MKIIHPIPTQRKEPQNVSCKWLWTFFNHDISDEKLTISSRILTHKNDYFFIGYMTTKTTFNCVANSRQKRDDNKTTRRNPSSKYL